MRKLIFEMGAPGRRAYRLPPLDVPEMELSSVVGETRAALPALPEVGEIEAVRHFTALSQMNFSVDTGFYPLGSCTMKYNPKINEQIAGLPAFADLHPYAPERDAQHALAILFETERLLCAVCGMDAFSLQPAAGAHGELTGLMMIKAYHESRGDGERNVILVPDSSHGTNPASAALSGFVVETIPSDSRGLVDLAALKNALTPRVAGLMLTNPNTLGLFEAEILEIAALVHGAGGLLYYDGANLNAIMGYTQPGRMGFDVMHVNVHKTFSAPHGGGGPGAGPVGVCARLVPFLPSPRVVKSGGSYHLTSDAPGAPFPNDALSIGRVRSFYGNFGVILRTWAYIRMLGAEGLKEVSSAAVAHANYLMQRLKTAYDLPYDCICMHEFVLSAVRQKEQHGVSASDIAKGLIDKGYHPPTVYFPLIVKEALMIEPTETETPETLREFAEAMLSLAEDAAQHPEAFANAPYTTDISRPDDTRAARSPVLTYTAPERMV